MYTGDREAFQKCSPAAQFWGAAIFIAVPVAGVVSLLWLAGLRGDETGG